MIKDSYRCNITINTSFCKLYAGSSCKPFEIKYFHSCKSPGQAFFSSSLSKIYGLHSNFCALVLLQASARLRFYLPFSIAENNKKPYSVCNNEKTIGFLMISGGREVD